MFRILKLQFRNVILFMENQPKSNLKGFSRHPEEKKNQFSS